MQTAERRPAKATWRDTIGAVLTRVMARMSAAVATAFVAYGAATHPESYWSPSEYIDDGSKVAAPRR